jgi:hypothetical protein
LLTQAENPSAEANMRRFFGRQEILQALAHVSFGAVPPIANRCV